MTPERMKEIDEEVNHLYKNQSNVKVCSGRFEHLTSEERVERMIEISNKLLSNIKNKSLMKNGQYQEQNGIMWYKDDKRHRDDGPACEYNNGNKAWWQNGKLHRIGAPAVEYHDGCLVYYYNGLRHRLDGPAAIYPTGDVEYWINGKEYGTIEQYEKDVIKLTS